AHSRRRQGAAQCRGRAYRLHPPGGFSRRAGRAGRAPEGLKETRSVKIKTIEPIAVALPMKKPVFMAGVEIRQADNILVRIEADGGQVGWGEAASAPTMTGETVESMMAAALSL